MQFLNHITDANLNIQTFYYKGNNDWQMWNKPEGVKNLYIFCLGSGSGGGPGVSAALGSAKRGGGGGAAAAWSILFTSADQMPSTLYIQPAAPGLGGTGISNGATGSLSYVSVQPNTTGINLILQSGATSPSPGQSGTNGGAGGSAGTVWTGSALSYGLLTGSAPGTGGNGSAATISTPGVDIIPTSIVSGGASGGSTNVSNAGFDGGGVQSQGYWSPNYLTTAGPGNSSGTASNGASAPLTGLLNLISTRTNLFFAGGAGGGASGTATGGSGGNGSYGCGGGGGGAGITGGAGGNGGPGIVIVVAW